MPCGVLHGGRRDPACAACLVLGRSGRVTADADATHAANTDPAVPRRAVPCRAVPCRAVLAGAQDGDGQHGRGQLPRAERVGRGVRGAVQHPRVHGDVVPAGPRVRQSCVVVLFMVVLFMIVLFMIVLFMIVPSMVVLFMVVLTMVVLFMIVLCIS